MHSQPNCERPLREASWRDAKDQKQYNYRDYSFFHRILRLPLRRGNLRMLTLVADKLRLQ
jgi:hypothetical protein